MMLGLMMMPYFTMVFGSARPNDDVWISLTMIFDKANDELWLGRMMMFG